MTRPAKKKIMAEAYFRKSAELKATIDRAKKEPIALWLKDRVAAMSDNIEPIQGLAVIGMTFVIHGIVLRTEDVMKTITDPASRGGLGIGGTAGPTGMTQEQINKLFGTTFTLPPPQTAQDTWEIWAISLAIAYIVVTQAGALVGLLGSGLQQIVPLFLPKVVA